MSSVPIDIHCPLSQVEEVAPLVAAGADSFYAGLVPPADLGLARHLLNRRHHPSNNFACIEDFERARDVIDGAGRDLFLTLNEHHYPSKVLSYVFTLLERLLRAPGLRGVIVADLALTAELHHRFPGLTLTASTGMSLLNRGALSLAQDLGVSRVVLPRGLALSEIATLTGAFPALEFEAFVLNERCPNVDGMCSFLHWEVTDRRFPNQCRFVQLDQVYLSPGADPKDGERVKESFSHSRSFSEFACGACYLRPLSYAGVRHAKIVGRGLSLKRKLKDLGFVVALRRHLLPEPPSQETYTRIAKRLRQEHYGRKCTVEQCYYLTPPEG